MSKDPAVLFYTSDFMSGVVGLTMQERGQYISLLCIQHQQGHLSEKTICLLLGITSVSEIPDVMEKFKIDEDGKYYNERMELEAEKRHSFVNSRKENAKLGGRPRKDKQKPSANHMEKHTDKRMGNENENENDVNVECEDTKDGESMEVNITVDNTEKVIDECIAYLNVVANRGFKPKTESIRKFIRARIRDGYTIDDFKRVIDNQWFKWKDTDMAEYMRPSTLFSAEKFPNYINAPDYSKQAVPKFQNKSGRFEQIDFDKIEV